MDGIELAFSHTFDSGFFIDANAAFMDSWATLEGREENLPLIGRLIIRRISLSDIRMTP